MTGLLVLTQPGTALAADKDSDTVETMVLHPTIAGTDGQVRYSVASLAGGGVQLSFVYVPDEAAGEESGRDQVQSKEFTVTVDAKAVATQTVTDDGGLIVPVLDEDQDDTTDADRADRGDDDTDSAETTRSSTASTSTKDSGAVVEQNVSEESTEVTLSATTEGVETVWVLPQQAPAAADPADQSWVTRTWRALVEKVTGVNSDSTSGSDEGDQEQGVGKEGAGESTPTSEPTSSPSSSATSAPSDSSSTGTSSTGSSSSTATSDDEDVEVVAGEGDGDDTCVLTQGQLTTSTGDDDTVDAALEDGPTAAATFSEEVRQQAARQASDCGEGSEGSSAEQDAEQEDGEDSSSSGGSSSSSSGETKVDVQDGDWLSGVAADRAAIEKLRGVDAEVAATWLDDSTNAWTLEKGAEYGSDTWDKSLIIALPPFPEGSSWEATAAGENDEYLRASFSTLASKWGDRNGQAFIELGWEMNGSWFDWAAKAGQEDAVGEAFARARSIQQEEFPKSLLGTRFNHESNGYDGNSEDLIAAMKGSVDFIGASYYNAYPSVASPEEFNERAQLRDGGGGPKGIDTWLSAAKKAGLPIEFGEWAASAKDGDSAAFIDGMHRTFAENAGPGAGQVFADVYFNVDKDSDNWRLNSGKIPESEAAYSEAFSQVGNS